jgi:hypothetical protein
MSAFLVKFINKKNTQIECFFFIINDLIILLNLLL